MSLAALEEGETVNRFAITRRTVATAAAVAVVAVVLGLLVWMVVRGRDAPTASAVLPSASPSASAAVEPSPAASAAPSVSGEPAPSASASAAPPAGESEQDRDLRRAGEAVVALVAKADELGAPGPDSTLTDLATYARGVELDLQQRILTGYYSRDLRQVGASTVQVRGVTYDPASGVFTVRACVDVSRVDLVDPSGRSVVRADRPDGWDTTYDVVKDGDAFYVTEEATPSGTTC